MDLQELKKSWNQLQYSPKSDTELNKMTAVKNHPVLKKIKIKLLVETTALSLFLAVYYSGFDGAEKPLYANILLLLGAIAYILSGLAGFRTIQRPIQGDDLKQSIANYMNSIRIVSKIAIGVSICYTTCLLLFFTSTITFSGEKKWIVLFGGILFINVFFWSTRIWKSWLHQLEVQIENFD